MQRHAVMNLIVCSCCDNEVSGNDIAIVMTNFIFCWPWTTDTLFLVKKCFKNESDYLKKIKVSHNIFSYAIQMAKFKKERENNNYLITDYLHKTSIKINVATDKGKLPEWNMTLNKGWNWSGCTKFALSASWTHGLIAQSVERLSRIQWSRVQIPLRPTFYSYFKESVNGEYNMYQLIPLHSWLPTENFD